MVIKILFCLCRNPGDYFEKLILIEILNFKKWTFHSRDEEIIFLQFRNIIPLGSWIFWNTLEIYSQETLLLVFFHHCCVLHALRHQLASNFRFLLHYVTQDSVKSVLSVIQYEHSIFLPQILLAITLPVSKPLVIEEEEQFQDNLRNLNMHKSMGLDKIHPRVSGKLPNVVI